jgi:hypothetical protein
MLQEGATGEEEEFDHERMRWARQMVLLVGTRNAYKILVRKL